MLQVVARTPARALRLPPALRLAPARAAGAALAACACRRPCSGAAAVRAPPRRAPTPRSSAAEQRRLQLLTTPAARAQRLILTKTRRARRAAEARQSHVVVTCRYRSGFDDTFSLLWSLGFLGFVLHFVAAPAPPIVGQCISAAVVAATFAVVDAAFVQSVLELRVALPVRGPLAEPGPLLREVEDDMQSAKRPTIPLSKAGDDNDEHEPDAVLYACATALLRQLDDEEGVLVACERTVAIGENEAAAELRRRELRARSRSNAATTRRPAGTDVLDDKRKYVVVTILAAAPRRLLARAAPTALRLNPWPRDADELRAMLLHAATMPVKQLEGRAIVVDGGSTMLGGSTALSASQLALRYPELRLL